MSPPVQVLDLPFLFSTRAAAEGALDGEIGRQLSAGLADQGILILAWGTAGWREFDLAARPIVRPSDARGLRIRFQAGAVYVSMLKAMGAVPIAIDNSEIFVALQQKTIYGIEIPPPTVVANKFYPALKYISMTNHLYNAAPLMMSKRRFDSLPPQARQVLVSAGKELLSYWRSAYLGWETTALTDLKAKGLTINQVDLPAFRTAMAPVYDEFRPKIGSALLDRALKAAER